MQQTDTYRIRESSPYIDGSKPTFFPEVLVKHYSIKKRWFKKDEIITTEQWECFVNEDVTKTLTCPPKEITRFSSEERNIVGFSNFTFAESWLRRYKEQRQTDLDEMRLKINKSLSVSLDENNSKIHEIK